MTSNVLEQASTPTESTHTLENPFTTESLHVSDELIQKAIDHLDSLRSERSA